MVSVELEVIGLEKLQERLRSYPERYEAAFAAALNDLFPRIVARIRALLPHRTGAMRRGVKVTRVHGGVAIHIPQYYRNQLTGRLKNLRLENLVSSIEIETAIARHL